uniref:glycerophosphodiester phosphodiesterase n=1 Tax=Brassica campestris TaxID=3711 RepID=A0A3P6AHQ9_BRACM|nr:unnamed protein product [Brassica rapa]
MYRVDKDIQNVTDSAINAILSFAGTIVISMNSVLPYNRGGLVRLKKADVVPRLKVRGVRVFVDTFSNEFVTQPLDLFSDSTVEVDFFFQTAKIDGIITELRVTSARYKNKQLHSLVIKRGFSGNTFVNNGLINMYSKCGDVDDSLSVFRRMSERNYVSWNSIIA